MNEKYLIILSVSVLANLSLLYLQFYQRKTPKRLSIEAQELLHELSGPGAMLEIRRLNPDDYFMRSPRG